MMGDQPKTNTVPKFAVVGHPNKGKSSLVATLTQNDSVQISSVSGTTEVAQSFPMRLDGRECYELIDTPGFQRARALLQQLQSMSVHAGDRKQVLAQFVRQPHNPERFHDELELLKPIVEGAAILYVVDGATPYRPEYEHEMEILRWSGQPRMAVINPISGNTYVEQWRQALDQFFSLVRVFDPMTAGFSDHIELIGSFALLDKHWQPSINAAVQALKQDRAQRVEQAVSLLTTACIDALCHQVSTRIPGETIPEAVSQALEVKLKAAVKTIESSVRKKIETQLRHHHMVYESKSLTLEKSDLFNQEDWVVWGLDKKQLLWLSAGGGAAAGALLDVGLGGSSLMLGALSGSIVAAGSSWWFRENLAKIKIGEIIPTGGREVILGPIKNSQFGWVFLGRGLHHLNEMVCRNHARRDEIQMQDWDLKQRMSELPKTDALKMASWLQCKGQRTLMERQQPKINQLLLKYFVVQ
ncbi:GTPase/DUF3482 domain-containing protein [Marinibactrum halimedae]|uniref:G domain-containing protein n=1 Tax=Marinibactrum halimedae TaxID=1444977 RepID=A0AA37WKT9_9GAMM|nr:GTPase/DUF3482 domain-containing protein [Marinibactrum halimedae]MCD9457663.1 GTPase/DUF3482 domain-containing protein [Marinibactrum halimedae]GLS24964.1 hypothetical protein GCM10007877_06780 [Marinibactrum halimedae]